MPNNILPIKDSLFIVIPFDYFLMFTID